MRSEIRPNNDQLAILYQAAIEFNKVKPWNYLWDGDLICVENPADGVIGYCSIMGKGGEHFALGVYI